MPGISVLKASCLLVLAVLAGCAVDRAEPQREPRDLTRTSLGGSESGRRPLRGARRIVAPCLAYEDTVTLRGRLTRAVYPGPPNYESVAAGDSAEAAFYLDLAAPICARAAWPDPDDPSLAPRDSVRRVQLVLDPAMYARLRPSLDQKILLRGTLFSDHTGHHHAPLLLRPSGPGTP